MRIVLELKDKISKDMMTLGSKISAEDVGIINSNSALSEATEALMVLGYDKHSVSNAVAGLDPKADTGEIIRLALKKLAK
jgi:Holliday junction DNA helicase RuvA